MPATRTTERPPTAETGHGMLLGRVAGIPVYLGRAWLLIAGGLVVVIGPNLARGAPGLGATAYLIAGGYAVILLVSVFLHEAAHALVARRCGVRVTRVVADLWGGHTAFEAAAGAPGRSALISAAGPLANAAVAGLCWWVRPGVDGLIPGLLVGATMITNALLAGFNLLPGMPLDGGYLVEAAVWRVTGARTSGTLVAGWCGRVVALCVVAWDFLPVLRGGRPNFVALVWMAMIGGFLWLGASHAIASARVGRRLGGMDPRQAATPAIHLPADSTAWEASQAVAEAPGSDLVLDDPDGYPGGLLDITALVGAAPDTLGAVPARAFLLRQPSGWVLDLDPSQDPPTDAPPPDAPPDAPLGPALDPRRDPRHKARHDPAATTRSAPADLEAVRSLMGASRSRHIALRDRAGRVVGVVHADSVTAHLGAARPTADA